MIAACLGLTAPAVTPAGAADQGEELVGSFRLQAGACTGGVSGSYIRMILPNGSPTGPFLSNADSSCVDQSYTPLQPGTDGGLSTTGYQATPSPAFDRDGNALAQRITRPAPFYGTGFATATNPVDPQTGARAAVPVVTATGGRLAADLGAFAVIWNNQHFNQGAPKPNGSLPGNTRKATGTYDAKTGAFTLQWTSQIVGGPFDKFTGLWHLQGTFVPSARAATGGKAAAPRGGTATGDAGSPATQPPTAPATRQERATAGPAAPQPSGAAAAPTAPSGASGGGGAPQVAGAASPLTDAERVASTQITSDVSWGVRWWLVALAVLLALLGFGTLAVLQRRLGAGSGPTDGASA